jgi:hypothetical protein
MGIFAGRFEHPLDMPVQGPQHADPRMHQEVAAFGHTDQTTDRGLPFCEVLLGLRQIHDGIGTVFERDELSTARQRYRIVELSLPA